MSKLAWQLSSSGDDQDAKVDLDIACEASRKLQSHCQNWRHDLAGCMRTMRYLADEAKHRLQTTNDALAEAKQQSIDNHLAFLEHLHANLLSPLGAALAQTLDEQLRE